MRPFKHASIDVRYGIYNGTKTNSDYFWHYLREIYDWREKNCLIPNISKMDYFVCQVAPGARLAAVRELVAFTPYDFAYSFEDENYLVSVLSYAADSLVPEILVREPRAALEHDIFYHMNQCVSGRLGTFSRFVGEAYRVVDIDSLVKAHVAAGTEFQSKEILGSENNGARFIETTPSPYTQNTVRYVQYYGERQIKLNNYKLIDEGSDFYLELEHLKQSKHAANITQLLGPVDHIATRVMQQDRENAILEIVKLTHHYPWGAYNVEEMNSSTNPTRNVYHMVEKHSPAKVFTAGNVPYFISFLEGTDNPTDIFARNFGRSMHHLAFEVIDSRDGKDNIDTVVEYIKALGGEFLGSLYGSRAEGIRQIFSKRSSSLGFIREYVQRYDDYDGFFTRKNVAKLTEAAGADELLRR